MGEDARVSANTILKKYGWGMRHAAGSSKTSPASMYTLLDFSITASVNKTSVTPDDTVTVTYTVKNNTNVTRKDVPMYFYGTYGGKYFSIGKTDGSVKELKKSHGFKSTKDISKEGPITATFGAKGTASATKTYKYKIKLSDYDYFKESRKFNFRGLVNWSNKDKETNPNNNETTATITRKNEPEVNPTIKINVVDMTGGKESVAGKKFAVFACEAGWAVGDEFRTKEIAAFNGSNPGFLGIAETDETGVAELDSCCVLQFEVIFIRKPY